MIPDEPNAIIVNSESATPSLLAEELEEAGIPVISFDSADVADEQLLDFVAEQHSDIAVTDISTPFKLQLAHFLHLRQDPRSDGAVWLVHSSNPGVIRALHEAGENVVADRPLNTRTLVRRVQSILRQRTSSSRSLWQRIRHFLGAASML